MKKTPLVLALALAAQGVSTASAVGGDSTLCKILFILLVIAPSVGVLVIALQAVRWVTSPLDPWARDKAKEGIMYVTIGLVVILVVVGVIVLVAGGPDILYSCVYHAGEGEVLDEAPLELSDSSFITTLRLYEGWNLFSTPFVLNDSNVSILFGGVRYDVIYSWNRSSDNWEYYTPEHGGGLRGIEIDNGYWIHMLENATVVLKGRAVVSRRNITLSSGWNLVGYSGYDAVPMSTALGDVDYLYVYGWSAAQALASSHGAGWSFSSKKGFNPSKAPPKPPAMKEPVFAGLANLSTMEPGQGYWIYLNQSAYWSYRSGYPR